MTRPDVATVLGWAFDGQGRLEGAVAELGPADLAAPSRLPGWSRGHVVTHLARNADALVNLLTWARTGDPTPMYASPEQRDADIEAGAGRGHRQQLDDLRATGRRFAATAAELPTQAWQARVRSAQGRDIPASEVPWMRVREVWLHLVDLGVGETVDAVPDAVAAELVAEVADWMSAKLDTAVLLRPEGHPETHMGPADDAPLATVGGPASRIAGWLVGRSGLDGLTCAGEPPALPRWL